MASSPASQQFDPLTRPQRLFAGILLLLLVDVIWVVRKPFLLISRDYQFLSLFSAVFWIHRVHFQGLVLRQTLFIDLLQNMSFFHLPLRLPHLRTVAWRVSPRKSTTGCQGQRKQRWLPSCQRPGWARWRAWARGWISRRTRGPLSQCLSAVTEQPVFRARKYPRKRQKLRHGKWKWLYTKFPPSF